MFSLRHLKAMVLLVLISLLSFGSTQVHSQGYGDTRQVQESQETHVSSTYHTYTSARAPIPLAARLYMAIVQIEYTTSRQDGDMSGSMRDMGCG